jgi:DNA-binding NtrC family response regulator
MNVLSQIVVASPDMENRRTLANILARLGLDPICTATVSECRVMLTKENVALVFCDRDLADGDYRDILAVSRATKRQPSVVLTGEPGTCEEYHEAIGLGVFGVTAMPYQPTDVEWMVIQARRYERKRTPEAEAGDHLWETEALNWAHTVAIAWHGLPSGDAHDEGKTRRMK